MPPFDHSCPALLGPGDRYFTMDHHRLGRTLLDEEVDSVFVRMERSVALTGVVFRRAADHAAAVGRDTSRCPNRCNSRWILQHRLSKLFVPGRRRFGSCSLC
jgi:hypothetical protein